MGITILRKMKTDSPLTRAAVACLRVLSSIRSYGRTGFLLLLVLPDFVAWFWHLLSRGGLGLVRCTWQAVTRRQRSSAIGSPRENWRLLGALLLRGVRPLLTTAQENLTLVPKWGLGPLLCGRTVTLCWLPIPKLSLEAKLKSKLEFLKNLLWKIESCVQKC